MKRGKPIKVRIGNVEIPIYELGDGRFAVVYRRDHDFLIAGAMHA